jgi:hypothetical protein
MPITSSTPERTFNWDEYYASIPRVYESPEFQYSKRKYIQIKAANRERNLLLPDLAPIPDLPSYEEWRVKGLKSLNAYSFTDRTKDYVEENYKSIAVIVCIGLCCIALISCLFCVQYGVIII